MKNVKAMTRTDYGAAATHRRKLPPMADLLSGFQADEERRGLMASTIERRAYSLRMVQRTFGSLLRLNRGQLETFLDTRPCGARARYCWLSNLHAFYAWAIREGLCEQDPTVRIVRPRLRQGLPRPIDPVDQSMLIRLASPMMRAWLCLGGYAGLRCLEIAGLERDMVLDYGDRPMLHIIGKGKRERLVPMHDTVTMALQSYGLPRRGHLFHQTNGAPFTPARVSQLGGRFMRDHGVQCSMHQLRHHFATYAYRGSHDIRAVQELLGHSSPTTTAIYTAWDPVSAAAAVASIPGPRW